MQTLYNSKSAVYEFLQIVAKVIIIAAILLVAVIVSLRVWRSDLDVAQLISPKQMVKRAVDAQVDWLPTRELDAIYQDGQIVARVESPVVDEKKSQVLFGEVFKSGELDLGRDFEFQKWRLRFRGAETLIGMRATAPEKGRILEKARCEIVGERSL